jgi:ubiquinone/menaquinone biosynthesis C-methylase UbiE
MGIYQRHILPRLTHWSMGLEQLKAYRARVVGGAKGRVLEIGIGSGLNLPFYGDAVEEVIGVDPSHELLAIAGRAAIRSSRKIRLLERSAESLPLDDRSVDTVVVTWALCSIPDPVAALREARRVLKPGGEFRFVEHGLSPDLGVRKWQHRLTPVWARCTGGCHLDRKTDALLRAAGFGVIALTTGYARGPRPLTYLYEGSANP